VLVAKTDNLLSAYVYLYKTSTIRGNILNMASVYFVQNIQNHKIYVGVTTGLIQDRWKKHVSEAAAGSRFKFHSAIRKYGPEAFFWSEVACFDLLADAYERERILIRILNSRECGYNTAHGGIDGVRKEWTINGTVYPSKTAAAKAHSVPYQKMIKRLCLGHTPEQAVGLVPMPTWKVGVIILEGVRYASRGDAARAYGLDEKMIGQRVNKLGWTLEQAFGLVPSPVRTAWNNKFVEVNGVQMSYASACKSIGYNEGAITVHLRRNPNDTPQQAFEILRARKESK
jgi:predicted GIY-YIG superfamily endonuclease